MTPITSSGTSDTDRARNLTLGWTRLDCLDHRLAAASGHVHVEQHDIRQPFRDQLDCRWDLVRLPDELDRVAELAADSGTEQVMVVDEEDPGSAGRVHARPGCLGS